MMVSAGITDIVAGALMSVVSTLPALTTIVSSRLMVWSCSFWGDGDGLGLGSCAAAAAAVHKRPRPTAGINPFIPSSLLRCEASTAILAPRPRDERHPMTDRRMSQREGRRPRSLYHIDGRAARFYRAGLEPAPASRARRSLSWIPPKPPLERTTTRSPSRS